MLGSLRPVAREPTEIRAWGAFFVLEEGPGFKVKRLLVAPGGRLSLQTHAHRSEHWTVISGTPTATVGKCVMELRRGQSVDIAQGVLHRLENFGPREAEVIEVQFGDYLGEDDITRYGDGYQPP